MKTCTIKRKRICLEYIPYDVSISKSRVYTIKTYNRCSTFKHALLKINYQILTDDTIVSPIIIFYTSDLFFSNQTIKYILATRLKNVYSNVLIYNLHTFPLTQH